jgi:hypothetical protein
VLKKLKSPRKDEEYMVNSNDLAVHIRASTTQSGWLDGNHVSQKSTTSSKMNHVDRF